MAKIKAPHPQQMQGKRKARPFLTGWNASYLDALNSAEKNQKKNRMQENITCVHLLTPARATFYRFEGALLYNAISGGGLLCYEYGCNIARMPAHGNKCFRLSCCMLNYPTNTLLYKTGSYNCTPSYHAESLVYSALAALSINIRVCCL